MDPGQEAARPGYQKKHYLVTFSALTPEAQGQGLIDVGSNPMVTRGFIAAAIRQATQESAGMQHDGSVELGRRGRASPLVVTRLVVGREAHENGTPHYHAAAQLNRRAAFGPIKAFLYYRLSLPSNWSSTHTQWWSALRYLAVPTADKPSVDASPLKWSAEDPAGADVDVHGESQEPFSARGARLRMEKREREASAKGKAAKFRKLDLYGVILERGLATPSQVIEWACFRGSRQAQTWVCERQDKLAEYLAGAHDWGAAQEKAATDRLTDAEMVSQAARSPCPHPRPCPWSVACDETFARNPAVSEAALYGLLYRVMESGPSKVDRVPLLCGPSNSGKTMLFSPIDEVFGPDRVYHAPACRGSYPLMGLVQNNKRFAFLDEFSPVWHASQRNGVDAATQLLFFQGARFEVPMAKNFYKSNRDVAWKHGVCVTAPMTGLWSPPANAEIQVTQEQIAHLRNRFQVFALGCSIPSQNIRAIPTCGPCFARRITRAAAQGAQYSAGAGGRGGREIAGPRAATQGTAQEGEFFLAESFRREIASQMASVSLARFTPQILEWCEEMGAATIQEIRDNVEMLIRPMGGLRPLETARLRQWAAH